MYKTKADLHRAWADTIEMTDSYNKEHKAKVDIKNCWQCKGALFGRRPTFDSDPALYSFAKGILYNEETEEHCPVFIGDKLWSFYTDSWYTVEQYSGSRFTGIFSWHAPKKKETFMLCAASSDYKHNTGNMNIPCPIKDYNVNNFDITLWGEQSNKREQRRFYFNNATEALETYQAITNILINNTKGN